MGFFVVIVFIVDFVILIVQCGIIDDYVCCFMCGMIMLIEDELFCYLCSIWLCWIKEIDEKFFYCFGIVECMMFDCILIFFQVEKFDFGDIVIDYDGDIMYYWLGMSSQVFVVGLFVLNCNFELMECLLLEL